MNKHRSQVRVGAAGGAIVFIALGVAALALSAGPASAGISSLGPGASENVGPTRTPPCDATVLMNGDDTWENGYAWDGDAVAPPDYGGFAEGYEGTGTVCGMRFHFSSLSGYYAGQTLDAFVYDSDGLNPQNVLSVAVGVAIDPPAIWPQVSVHDVDTADAGVNGGFFVGYWPNWPGAMLGWFCAADLDGMGGMPRTHVVPDLGYPSGWQDPSVIWGLPTQAMGCDAYLIEGPPPTPVRVATWGAIKSLY